MTPPKYKNLEELSAKIDEYFIWCDENDKPYTICGLNYYLGFSDRHGLDSYESKKAYYPTIKRAKLKCEMQKNENLVAGKGSTPGIIFDLKNNFGWKEKTEQELTGNLVKKVFVKQSDIKEFDKTINDVLNE